MSIVRSTLAIHFTLVGLMVAVSIWGAFTLSDDVLLPMHWNANMEVDRWGGKIEGLWLLPAIAIVVGVFMGVAPRLRRRHRNIERALPVYRVVWLAVTSLLVVVHVSIVGSAGSWRLDPGAAVPYALGVLLVAMGNSMGKMPSNPIAGVRSRITLGSEEVWGKTHRKLGRWLVGLGIVGLVIALFGHSAIAVRIMAIGTIVSPWAARIYARLVDRRRRKETT